MQDLRLRFHQGLSFEDYLKGVTQRQEEWQKSFKDALLSQEEIERLQNSKARLNLIAISEDWCGDSVRNLPVIARLAQALPNAVLRVIHRDQNLDLMDQYSVNGKRKIPTIAVLDEGFNHLAFWIEKPSNAEELKKTFMEQEDGKEKYLTALRNAVKEEFFAVLEKIKER